MRDQNDTNEMFILGLTISFIAIAIVISARSTLNAWTGLLFMPIYVIVIIVTLVSSNKILSDISIKKSYPKLLWYVLACAISSFFVVGDNGDNGAYYYQGKGYEYNSDLPKLVQMFEQVAVLVFIATGFMSMIYLIKFATSKTY